MKTHPKTDQLNFHRFHWDKTFSGLLDDPFYLHETPSKSKLIPNRYSVLSKPIKPMVFPALNFRNNHKMRRWAPSASRFLSASGPLFCFVTAYCNFLCKDWTATGLQDTQCETSRPEQQDYRYKGTRGWSSGVDTLTHSVGSYVRIWLGVMFCGGR